MTFSVAGGVSVRDEALDWFGLAGETAGLLRDSLTLRVAVLDGRGTIRAVNEAWRSHALLNGGETVLAATGEGVSYLDVTARAAADGDPWAQRALEGISGVLAGDSDHFCLEYPCPSAEKERWFLLHVSPLGDGTSGAIVTHIDVTEQRKNELQSLDREAWYRTLMESTSDLISVHELDSTILWVSPACRRLLGWEPEEMVGRLVFELFHPDDLPSTRDVHRRFLREGETQTVEARHRRKDGGFVWMEATIRRLPGSESQPRARVIAVTRDVSERKRAEEEQGLLRRELERAALDWRSTFDAIESPILLVGLDGRVVRSNRAARQLIGRADLAGTSLAELEGGQPLDAVAALVQRALAGVPSQVCESRDEARGKIWEVEATLAPANGGEAKVIVQIRDITPTIELQESLRRTETMAALGAVVAGVAHEVRNPLFGMAAVLDAFESRYRERPEFERYVRLLRRELERMTTLMQSLLDYGKPARLELATGDLLEPLEGALAACRVLAEQREVELAIAIDAIGVPLRRDPRQLAEAFKNVVENALHFSPAGGEVGLRATVVTVEGSPWVRVTVEDRGPGFAPYDLEQAFEPFFSRREGGTGLGLSIVARIVEGHAGRVRVGNRRDGGARVEIDLPALVVP